MKKGTKRKCKILSDPIYNREVFFLLGGTAAELRGFFYETHGISPDFDEATKGLQWQILVQETQSNRFYLWMEEADDGDLVHETAHLTWDVMRDVGLEPSQETEEAYAYLQEWYYREILEAMQEMKGRKRKG